jgi:hypothetical protein
MLCAVAPFLTSCCREQMIRSLRKSKDLQNDPIPDGHLQLPLINGTSKKIKKTPKKKFAPDLSG